MKCWDCERFKILQEPIHSGGRGYWDFGRAKCMKHNLVVDFPNHGKLKKLECVEEVKPELATDKKATVAKIATTTTNDAFVKKGQTVMEDIEKVMRWLEGLTFDDWRDYHSDSEVNNMAKATLELLKEQQEKIRQLESMNVSASGNGTAIGVLHGGMTIKKEYHQQAKEVYNIGHVDRLDL